MINSIPLSNNRKLLKSYLEKSVLCQKSRQINEEIFTSDLGFLLPSALVSSPDRFIPKTIRNNFKDIKGYLIPSSVSILNLH